jgi:exosome complex RNA-binding protein Csl4
MKPGTGMMEEDDGRMKAARTDEITRDDPKERIKLTFADRQQPQRRSS